MSTFQDHRHTRRGSFGLVVRDLNPQHDDEDDRLILTAAHLLSDVPVGTRVLCAPPGPEPGMVVAIESADPGAATFVHGIKQVFTALEIALP